MQMTSGMEWSQKRTKSNKLNLDLEGDELTKMGYQHRCEIYRQNVRVIINSRLLKLLNRMQKIFICVKMCCHNCYSLRVFYLQLLLRLIVGFEFYQWNMTSLKWSQDRKLIHFDHRSLWNIRILAICLKSVLSLQQLISAFELSYCH